VSIYLTSRPTNYVVYSQGTKEFDINVALLCKVQVSEAKAYMAFRMTDIFFTYFFYTVFISDANTYQC
jgi:hypothetical protein